MKLNFSNKPNVSMFGKMRVMFREKNYVSVILFCGY